MDDLKPLKHEEARPTQDDVEQEFYTALRAAGASAEEAQAYLQATLPAAAVQTLLGS